MKKPKITVAPSIPKAASVKGPIAQMSAKSQKPKAPASETTKTDRGTFKLK